MENDTKLNDRPTFDPKAFLATVSRGRTVSDYQKEDVVFLQSSPAEAVFYIQKGKIKIVVASKQGKEAVIAILGPGDFFGEGCLIGQPLRLATARAMVESEVMRVGKTEMIRVLHAEPAFGELFMAHLLTRNSRIEEDLDPATSSSTRAKSASHVRCSFLRISVRTAGRSRSPPRSARRHWLRSSARHVPASANS